MVYDERILFPLLECLNYETKRFLKKKVPVNLKVTDAFHITIEEYLQALITLVEELVRTTKTSPPPPLPYPPFSQNLRSLFIPYLPLLQLTCGAEITGPHSCV